MLCRSLVTQCIAVSLYCHDCAQRASLDVSDTLCACSVCFLPGTHVQRVVGLFQLCCSTLLSTVLCELCIIDVLNDYYSCYIVAYNVSYTVASSCS